MVVKEIGYDNAVIESFMCIKKRMGCIRKNIERKQRHPVFFGIYWIFYESKNAVIFCALKYVSTIQFEKKVLWKQKSAAA